MIRFNYPELFADDPAWLSRAQSLATRTFEFSEYLVDRLHVPDAGCLMHIAGGLHRQGKSQRAVHLAEVLCSK